MGDDLEIRVRAQQPGDADAVFSVILAAFDDDPTVAPLDADLARRSDSRGYVAEHDGRIVGHVRLTRCWVDAGRALVEALVLSPLSVSPDVQGRGVGTALVGRAVAEAESSGAPAVVLEGDPGYYSRLGFRPASELGITPASPRVPRAAFQTVRFPAYDAWMRGQIVYPEPFWTHDAVGLRGDTLAEVRAALGT
jgi:putative acetyltransferase